MLTLAFLLTSTTVEVAEEREEEETEEAEEEEGAIEAATEFQKAGSSINPSIFGLALLSSASPNLWTSEQENNRLSHQTLQ